MMAARMRTICRGPMDLFRAAYHPIRVTTYCDIAPGHPDHGPYHDEEYGFPVRDDDRLFERLVLEINQAGLSWLTILRKRAAFRERSEERRVGKECRSRWAPDQ